MTQQVDVGFRIVVVGSLLCGVGLFQSKIPRLKHSPVRSTGTIENEAAFSHPGYIIIMIFFFSGRGEEVSSRYIFFSLSLNIVFFFYFWICSFFFPFLSESFLLFYLSLVALLALFGRQRDMAICRTAKVGWTLASSTSTTTTTTQSPRESPPPPLPSPLASSVSITHCTHSPPTEIVYKRKRNKESMCLANVVLLVGTIPLFKHTLWPSEFSI